MLLSAALVSAAGWRTNGGFFYTANTVPQGTNIRIKVASGKFGMVRVGEWTGARFGVVSKPVQVWNNVIPGQVLSCTLPENAMVSIDTGNYRARATRVTHQAAFDELQFDPGWVLQVKIPPPDF